MKVYKKHECLPVPEIVCPMCGCHGLEHINADIDWKGNEIPNVEYEECIVCGELLIHAKELKRIEKIAKDEKCIPKMK